MSGIIFFKTAALDSIVAFYANRIGMEVWLRQPAVTILKHGNLLLGFHRQPDADTAGLVTFFYGNRAGVDAMYAGLRDIAAKPPERNESYDIYHFFARDPEGRMLEFQSFEHPVAPHLDGEELLLSRRSVRRYDPRPVPEDVIDRVFTDCACAPSAKNTQPWYFLTIRDADRLERLAAVRGDSSAPIARASMAVAICTDPARTPREVEDGCIAAYHFLLASWAHGLGTCWIGGMNQDAVKEILGVPGEHYVATVTPVGYPAETRPMPARREIEVREAG
jgi:nitroreductase